MKKQILKLSALALLLSATCTSISCSNDDNPFGEEQMEDTGDLTALENIAQGNLEGAISQNITLNPLIQYNLTGIFTVTNGATLTIPAGTTIVANGSNSQENYIHIDQGAQINVEGTTAEPVVMTSANGNAGQWGGLVITGNAITTEGVNATAEVGNLSYGGTDAADDSGSIQNLVIVGSGAVITGDSQFNGLSLYAVGSETVIENIAILDGEDDGVEFFGGSANATNIYVEGAEDDAIDWTEGWNGTIDNAFIIHNSNFSTAVEADGIDGEPTINNLTAISSVGGTALQFKSISGATITGLSLTGYDTNIDIRDNAPLAGIILNGEEADITASYNATPIDLNSPEWDFIRADIGVDAFEDLPSQISSNTTLSADIVYNLTGITTVNTGATLTIPAGTTIIANGTNSQENYIHVAQGAQIDVQGEVDNEVIMTSLAGDAGSWGGLVITGNAVTTEGINAIAEVGNLSYGGTDTTDNSGSIQNLVIIGSGAIITGDSQFNGLSLYAVGSETIIENIAILNGEDDGVEFFGGSANVTNIYVEGAEDDAIDWTEGWDGTIDNAFIVHNSNFSTAVEADGINGNPTINNLTAVSTVGGTALQFKSISGATITGLSLTGYDTSVDIRDNAPLTGIQLNGADADVDTTYEGATTVDFTGVDFLVDFITE